MGEKASKGLSFGQLRQANVRRCETAFHALDHWNPMEWGAACAGEVGEGINAAKKLRRVQDSEQYKKTLPTTDVTVQDVADEIADAVIYADLWAASMGIDLGAAVADKFNRTSGKVRSDVKLPAIESPDLLGALDYMVQSVDRYFGNDTGEGRRSPKFFDGPLGKAHRVIAKARGESNE